MDFVSINSLGNLGIGLMDKQEQDEQPSQIISQMPVLPLLGRLELPLLSRSVPPVFGRSEPPLLCRSVPPLLGNYKSSVTKHPNLDSYIVDFPWAGNKPPEDDKLDLNFHMVKAKFKSFMTT